MRDRPAFSLLEVMLVVTIGGVLSAGAVVTLRGTITNGLEHGSARSLAALINRARVTAISTHSRVAVTASTSTHVATLSACKARFGASGCADGGSLLPLAQGTLAFNTDSFRGVRVTGVPATPLVFNALGFPEQATTYSFVLDHPERPGVRTVVVSAAGEVLVQ